MRRLFWYLIFLVVACGAIDRTDCYYKGHECREAVPSPSPVVGAPGSPGAPGTDGYSIAYSQTTATNCTNGGTTLFFGRDLDRTGVLKFTPEAAIMSTTICNGLNGENGPPGTPAAPIQIVDPCGKQTSYDEILVRISPTQLLASFSDSASGQNTRFTLLKAGTFSTTDGTYCIFTITTDLQIINEHN